LPSACYSADGSVEDDDPVPLSGGSLISEAMTDVGSNDRAALSACDDRVEVRGNWVTRKLPPGEEL